MRLNIMYVLLFLILVSQGIHCLQCHQDERSALLQLKSSFTIGTFTDFYDCDDQYYESTWRPKTDSWDENTNCCAAWSGVTCDNASGHVIRLDLSCSRLLGTLSSNNSLFFLDHLQRLDLSRNDFRGSPISSKFGQFKNMTHLVLSESNFSGLVPLEISDLSNLVSFELSSYQISATAEMEAATFKAIVQNLKSLKQLLLASVYMPNVPPSLMMNFSSSSLESLDLSFCFLHGKLPEDVFRLPQLRQLHLRNNPGLTGSFPKTNWSNPPLRVLDLSYTRFSIDFPHLIAFSKSLTNLSLSVCSFVEKNLALVGNLPEIVFLDLSYNNLSGQIPWSSFNLERLDFLNLSGNNFTVQLPEIHNDLAQNLSSHGSSKYLVSVVPSNLTFLLLAYNSLNGTIPSWLYALPSLDSLDLSGNSITGELGDFQSTSLHLLRLSQNKLHGIIPKSIFHHVNISGLDLSLNSFTGRVEWENIFKLEKLWYLDLSSNNLSLSSFNNFMNSTLGNLVVLGLSSCNLNEFPQFLRYSKNLVTLDLSFNKIEGSVPKWLWEGKYSLNSLILSNNLLSFIDQPLPWMRLQVLDLRSNLFFGPLPISSPSLQYFLVSKNKFVGEIPTSICNMTSLSVLDLSYNNLSGNIPQCIGTFSKYLTVIDMQMNKLHGTIPTTFSVGNKLKTLNLNGNQLEGPLPQSLVNCQNLEVLDLGNNKLNDTFPSWLESFPELRVLVLRSNRFHGFIGVPKTRIPFPQLRIMDLSYNKFDGFLPTNYFENFQSMMMNTETGQLEYMGQYYYKDSIMLTMKGLELELVKILTIFTTIDLSSNNFTGEIPDLIGRLKALKGLNLSHNMLRGIIPQSMGNLTNLEWLDLSSNELVGDIPLQLTDLTSLAFLNLSQNQLVGPIPHDKQFDTFNNDSFEGNSGLCGYALSKTCGDTEAPMSSNQKGNSEGTYGFNWKTVLMGYGCGTIFGIFIGYIVLFLNKKTSYWILKWL